jgi:hypothetical protein
MTSMRNIGKQGLADFFTLMLIKDMHWYSIMLLDNPDSFNNLHGHVFPSLSKILNIDEEMMRLCLQSCGLLHFKKDCGFIIFAEREKLQQIILSVCSTLGRDWRPITIPCPIGTG